MENCPIYRQTEYAQHIDSKNKIKNCVVFGYLTRAIEKYEHGGCKDNILIIDNSYIKLCPQPREKFLCDHVFSRYIYYTYTSQKCDDIWSMGVIERIPTQDKFYDECINIHTYFDQSLIREDDFTQDEIKCYNETINSYSKR